MIFQDAGAQASALEQIGFTTLLHTDPDPNKTYQLEIRGLGRGAVDLLAIWPEPENSQVQRSVFQNIHELREQGAVFLTLSPNSPAQLVNDEQNTLKVADQLDILPATWDAPDLVWIGEVLPFPQVVQSLTIAWIAAVLPALLYVGLLYRADRYEKDPRRLLAAAMFWGALPALIVALLVQIFFDLPVDLLGPEAIEAVRAGLVAPLIEEILKGAAVLYIARRYRREFDNVLDGIIYGATVGMGYAMTANVLSYLGAFFLKGFAALNGTLFVEGLIYGLNSAFYTAVFGAGLGYARLQRDTFGRRWMPVMSFLAAFTLNAGHKWILRASTGISLTTLSLTLAGIIALIAAIAISLRRQRECIRTELRDELPGRLYMTYLEPTARAHLQWQAFRRGGWRAWRAARRFYVIGVELAFKKMQFRLLPEEEEMGIEAEGLKAILDELSPQMSVYLQRTETAD